MKKSTDFDSTASLDRRNNNIGYTKSNIIWVHKNVNFMKADFTEREFLDICKEVVSNVVNNPL